MTNAVPYPLTDAKGVSAALAALNVTLTSGLSWLTKAYGQGQRLTKEKDNRAYSYPAIYTGGQGGLDYLSMFPDEHLAASGGFSWWDVQNPVQVNDFGGLRFNAGLIVWFDFMRVYPSPLDWKANDVWNVAKAVLDVLDTTGNANIDENSIEVNDRPERVYPGLSHNDIKRNYSMRPYGVFRIDMDIFWNNYDC